MTRFPQIISRYLWIWPLAAALVLGGVGFWVHNRIEQSTRAELGSRLQTLLNADVAALRLWFSERQTDVKSLVVDVRIQAAIVELAHLASDTNMSYSVLANADAGRTLQLYLKPLLQAQNYMDYVVVGPDRRIWAAPRRAVVGRPAPGGYDLFLQKALNGEVAISRPFAREMNPSQRSEGPTMFVAAPVCDGEGRVVAVLGLRMRPEEEFSRIFSVARMGRSGEAYAFDRRGIMLTASRFEDELKQLGLIPNLPEATAILNLRLADPGRLLTTNASPLPGASVAERPARERDSGREGASFEEGRRPVRFGRERFLLPLTRMGSSAVKGQSGHDVDGYRNYRGEMVVGAWAWLPEYGMGVATEVGRAEAYEALFMLRKVFLVLFLLLVISAVAIFCFVLLVERLQASARKNALMARRLGQYVLVQEMGRGATGIVYRARHALLRRPVAVKLLSPELTNESNAAHFEREAQMTSQLTHPNTVAIYDYGRSPEGLFYYVMEYLSGIDLDQLVRQFGPQCEGRVIHILRQICGSLAEAHRIGLIHRDVKPANVILTRRGGVGDVVKVLDFGLVKAVHPDGKSEGEVKGMVGTPHFMAPEAVEHPEKVDGRGDLYSVGAVGYWLLCGKTLFDTDEVKDLLVLHARQTPMRPCERAGRSEATDLEELLMQCLALDPAQRPPSAEALEEALGRCAAADTWAVRDAEKWWGTAVLKLPPQAAAAMVAKTLVIAPER